MNEYRINRKLEIPCCMHSALVARLFHSVTAKNRRINRLISNWNVTANFIGWSKEKKKGRKKKKEIDNWKEKVYFLRNKIASDDTWFLFTRHFTQFMRDVIKNWHIK